MNNKEQAYFNILRAYFGLEKQIYECEDINWNDVIQLASVQGTLPLVADYALKLTDNSAPNKEQKVLMRQIAMQNMLHQQKLRTYLKLVKECLDNAGIPFVLLKGYGLAALYPNPDVRSSGDIDIFVGIDNFHKANALLKQLPDVHTCDNHDTDEARHFNLHWENMQYVIEVHRVTGDFVDRKENDRYRVLEELGVFERAEKLIVDGVEYMVPSTAFNMFYVFFHMWHHYLSEGLHMKQLIDWLLVLRHVKWRNEKISALEKDLIFFRLLEPWQVFATVLVEYLGVNEKDIPCFARKSDKARKLLDYILYGEQRKYLREKTYYNHSLMHKFETIGFLLKDYRVTAEIFPSYARHQLWGSIKHGLVKTFDM